MINARIITCLHRTKLFTYCSLSGRPFSNSVSVKLYHYIVLELKVELAKIKTEVKELKKQISVIHLSLVKHGGKSTSSISIHFQHKYPFPKSKKKIHFPLYEIKIQKEVGEKLGEKLTKKAEKEEEGV